jgi:hypothetical protein
VARRGREAALKRAREKSQQEKREVKRERQAARREGDDQSGPSPANEQALMEEFARLSERHESNQISTADYQKERSRIFTELGFEDNA